MDLYNKGWPKDILKSKVTKTSILASPLRLISRLPAIIAVITLTVHRCPEKESKER